MKAIVCQHTTYMQKFGIDSFVCCAVLCDMETYEECKKSCSQELDKQIAIFSKWRCSPHYQELDKIRNKYYQRLEMTFDSEKICALFEGSKGYFRQIFKSCYGFTLHDDCTLARISKAKYCLAMTLMSLAEIAEQCDYHDAKYFMRQFQQETGVTAIQYRNMTK